ncbi:MAG TPA: hypothetical protein VN461_02100 [Vicinamibacteria bacterium]|nr:hypothetical protein [Vicinamibacteria bacterium]
MRRLIGLFVLALLVTAAASAAEGKVEVTILGGASLLDVTKDVRTPICLACPSPAPAEAFPPLRPPDFQTSRTASLGVGFLLGFRFGYDLGAKAQLEVGFGVEPSRTQRTVVTFRCLGGAPCPFLAIRPVEDKVASFDYDAALLYHLGGAKLRPFLLAGFGGISFDTPDRVRTNFSFNFGAGLKLSLGRVGARLEAGDQLVLDHYLTGRAEHDLRVRAGLFFRP